MKRRVNRFIPKSTMGILAIILVVVSIFNAVFVSPGLRSSWPRMSLLLDAIPTLLAIPALYYIWKIYRFARRKMLWKIKRRLILANIFIGAIPLILVVGIFYVSALGFYYQFSYYLITNQIGIHSAQIHAFNLSFRESIQELLMQALPEPCGTSGSTGCRCQVFAGGLSFGLSGSGFAGSAYGPDGHLYQPASSAGRMRSYEIPRWLENREFHGLVVDDTQPREIMAPVSEKLCIQRIAE
jgi:hypothetical protein